MFIAFNMVQSTWRRYIRRLADFTLNGSCLGARYSSKAPFTGGDEDDGDARERRKGKPRAAKEAMKSPDGAIDRGEPGPNAPPVQVGV